MISSAILKHTLKFWDNIFTDLNKQKITIKKIAISFYNLLSKTTQLIFEVF
jgi:hypothetical protein